MYHRSKCKSIKLLEENIGENPPDPGLSRVLRHDARTPPEKKNVI